MMTSHNISYAVGSSSILHPMSFELQTGAVTVLLGANGAGKSTLLRILAGDLTSATGEVLLDGKPLGQYSALALARRRAVLTQHYAVPLPFTSEEIVLMGRYPYEGLCSAAENALLVRSCMEEMEVEHFGRRLFNTLSGGEQQRVQMARVLAQLASMEGDREKTLLLDEPTSSLDYLQQQLILSKARSLAHQGYGVGVVLHDLNLAAQYADKILLMKEGYLVAEGTAAEVLQPALIGMAFDIDVDIITDEGYPFPILVPAMHHRNRITQLTKSTSYGTHNRRTVTKR